MSLTFCKSFPNADVLSVSSNLCARAWKEQHPNGLTDAYEKYWNKLNDADCKVYQLQYLLSIRGVFDSVCQIWTDKSAKLKEMVRDVRDCVLCFTDDRYPDASANCRYCIRGGWGGTAIVTWATGTDEAE